jgi:hypothetical protein
MSKKTEKREKILRNEIGKQTKTKLNKKNPQNMVPARPPSAYEGMAGLTEQLLEGGLRHLHLAAARAGVHQRGAKHGVRLHAQPRHLRQLLHGFPRLRSAWRPDAVWSHATMHASLFLPHAAPQKATT